MKTPPIALTIAGSDSSGGAGIQADLKTFSALGVYGASVITALTAQNTRTVAAIHDPPAAFIAAQIDAVFADLRVAAVKIGMLSRCEAIVVVAERLVAHGAKNIVLDPVMVAKGGARLLEENAVAALREHLVERALVVTPNIPEAAVLIGESVENVMRDPEAACTRIATLGARAVVLKGGHGVGPSSDDLLYDGRAFTRFSAPRNATRNTHGTGCTFSSAIAAHLALGMNLEEAVRGAKAYVSAAIAAGAVLEIGGGHGPVHHFHALWATARPPSPRRPSSER
ncbi:MAG: bifunctional hydroxymethylpyrimidine kinase/phosphomethylpyrimidine kinase [bacterium]